MTRSAADWRHQADCLGEYPDLWFPHGGQARANDLQRDAAKAICADCPVRVQCGEWALATGQEYGVWGGLDEEERRAIHRRRRYGSAFEALPEVTFSGRRHEWTYAELLHAHNTHNRGERTPEIEEGERIYNALPPEDRQRMADEHKAEVKAAELTAAQEAAYDEPDWAAVERALAARRVKGLRMVDRLAAAQRLYGEGHTKPSAIAYRLGVSGQTATKMLRLLAQAGWLPAPEAGQGEAVAS